MSGSKRPRHLLPVLLVTVLVAGLAAPAHALSPAPRASIHQGEGEPLSALWTALSRLWERPAGAVRGLHSLAGAEGASLDPHGGSNPGTGGTSTAVNPSGSH